MNGVMELLKLWVKDIAIIFVLISLIEIILPNDNMKRYIDMVTGLLVLTVIISPFVKFIQRDFSLDREVLNLAVQQINADYNDDPKLLELQEKQIKDMYIGIIKEEILELVNTSTECEIDSINLSIYEEEKNYGQIKEVEIVLKKIKEQPNSEATIMVGKIEEIHIGDRKEKERDIKELENDELIESLHEKFNIPKDNIKVFIYEEGEKGG